MKVRRLQRCSGRPKLLYIAEAKQESNSDRGQSSQMTDVCWETVAAKRGIISIGVVVKEHTQKLTF